MNEDRGVPADQDGRLPIDRPPNDQRTVEGALNDPDAGDLVAASEDSRLAALVAVCSAFGVEAIYAFGSRTGEVAAWVRGELDALKIATGDVDIGIRTHEALDVHAKVRLAIRLEDFFGVPRVDLVCLADADPFIAVNIIRGERLYEADLYTNAEYELYVLRRAGDLIPLEEERTALVLGRKP